MKTESAEQTSLEVLPPSALEAAERASIDVQISTAKKFPRSIQTFKQRAIDLATLDEETAESCLYRRPVGKDKQGNVIFAAGMSVRMAEIVGATYGNLRVRSYIVEQTPRFVRAVGEAIDLEANFANSSEVVESTVDMNGRPYSERQRLLIAKVALSKARRDATFVVVPKAIARPVEVAVIQLLSGDTETLEKRRAKVMAWLSKIGLDPKRVWAVLRINGEAELGAAHLETLTGLRTALKDGDTTLDEAFPPLDAPKAPGKLSDLVDRPQTNGTAPTPESAAAPTNGANGATATASTEGGAR